MKLIGEDSRGEENEREERIAEKPKPCTVLIFYLKTVFSAGFNKILVFTNFSPVHSARINNQHMQLHIWC